MPALPRSGARSKEDLQQLWVSVPHGAVVTVVTEPTRNAWVPLAAWFRCCGAIGVMVPPEQSTDLRDYEGDLNTHSSEISPVR